MNYKSSQHMVLVVDDSPDTLGMLNASLEQAGMTTLVALEGPQAIRIAQKMLPDIILLDAMMPGMSGFDVCRILKNINELSNIPVIFMTGLSETCHIVEGFEAGGVDYLTKPIKTTELLVRMKTHLNNSRITKSAHHALDSSGNCIFCVTHQGQIVWSTPRVNQRLLLTPDKKQWHETPWPHALQRWFRCDPEPGMSYSASETKQAFKFTLIRHNIQSDEFLLKLEETNGNSEVSVLRQYFPVTPREADVLLWVAKGKTNREIGQILGTSPRTINKHLEQVFKKLHVENRTSAAAKALKYLGESLKTV